MNHDKQVLKDNMKEQIISWWKNGGYTTKEQIKSWWKNGGHTTKEDIINWWKLHRPLIKK